MGELSPLHAAAVAAIEERLTNAFGARDMSPAELASFSAYQPVAGFASLVRFSNGEEYSLAILVSADSPFRVPRLHVIEAPPAGTWPHLEEEGRICVFPDGASVSPQAPADVAEGLFREGVALLEEILAGRRNADFDDEFTSYWNLGLSPMRRVLSLLAPERRNRAIVVFSREEGRLVAGESKHQLHGWLTRRYGRADPASPRLLTDALLLWPQHLPARNRFPSKGPALRELLLNDANALTLLGKYLEQPGEVKNLVLGFQTAGGVGFGAVTIDQPRTLGAPSRPVNTINRGFRPGRVPAAVAVQRGLNATVNVGRSIVDRADRDWIHGRDHDPSQLAVSTKRIVLIGAGSVGSTLAELLAKSGFQDIYIIDPEVLAWENLSRHALGAQDIALGKATSLARRLSRALPHLDRLEGADVRFQPSATLDWHRVRQADLVIATTADWACESFLNALQLQGNFPPILYCWVEAYVAAAHALYIPGGSACLQCGMTPLGRPLVPVTEWPGDGQFQIPACGGAFTPYGAADLAWAHALHAREVVGCITTPRAEASRKIWVGDIARVIAAGGRVSEGWLRVSGDPGSGQFVTQLPWPADNHCPVCAMRAAA